MMREFRMLFVVQNRSTSLLFSSIHSLTDAQVPVHAVVAVPLVACGRDAVTHSLPVFLASALSPTFACLSRPFVVFRLSVSSFTFSLSLTHSRLTLFHSIQFAATHSQPLTERQTDRQAQLLIRRRSLSPSHSLVNLASE